MDTLSLCNTIVADIETRAEARARKAQWDREDALLAAAHYFAASGGNRPVNPAERSKRAKGW